MENFLREERLWHCVSALVIVTHVAVFLVEISVEAITPGPLSYRDTCGEYDLIFLVLSFVK